MTCESSNACKLLVEKMPLVFILGIWGNSESICNRKKSSKQFLLTLVYALEPRQLIQKIFGSYCQICSSNAVSAGLQEVPVNSSFFINMKFFLLVWRFSQRLHVQESVARSVIVLLLMFCLALLLISKTVGKKVKRWSAAPDDVINFHNLSRFKVLLIGGCWLELTNKF